MKRHIKGIITVFLLSCLVNLASAKEAAFSYTQIRYLRADSFKRISEYFTAEEFSSDRIWLRTSEERDGLYFIAKLNTPAKDLPRGAYLQLQYVSTLDNQEYESVFELPQRNESLLYIGLTANPELTRAQIAAWSLSVKVGDRVLAEESSYTWSYTEGS